MKKLLFLLLFSCCITMGVNAQQRWGVNSRSIDYYNNWEFSVGSYPLTSIVSSFTSTLNGLGDASDSTYDINDNYRRVPALNFSYGRQLSALINLGVMVSYSQMKSDIILNSSGEEAGKYRLSGLSVMPTMRFDWYRADILHCYSRAGVGVGKYMDCEKYDDSSKDKIKNSTVAPFADLVPFGIAIGRSVYGFAEVSVGSIGFYKFGAGYRF